MALSDQALRIPTKASTVIDDTFRQWGVWLRSEDCDELRAKDRTFEMACQSVKNKKPIPRPQRKYEWMCRKCGMDHRFEPMSCKCGGSLFTKLLVKRLPWSSNKETRPRGKSWVVNHDPNNAMAMLNAMILEDFRIECQAVLYLRFASIKKMNNQQIARELNLKHADYVSAIFNATYWVMVGVMRLRMY